VNVTARKSSGGVSPATSSLSALNLILILNIILPLTADRRPVLPCPT
jgi:hypothetical protein